MAKRSPSPAPRQPEVGGPPPPLRMCPKCKSALVATVAYGLRANDPAFMRALARGEIVMAEGDIPMKMPAWACRACGHRWGRAR